MILYALWKSLWKLNLKKLLQLQTTSCPEESDEEEAEDSKEEEEAEESEEKIEQRRSHCWTFVVYAEFSTSSKSERENATERER